MNAIDELNLKLGIGPRRPQLPRALQLKGYTAIKQVGKGSYGSAILVFHERDKQYSIAKEVVTSAMTDKQKADAQNEIKILSSLQHPNIIQYKECFTENDRVIIIMEYADGGDLEARIRAKQVTSSYFRPVEATRIFGQVALAIKHLHDRKILHRDLKSQNVFLTKTGVAKLGDFGLSTVLQNSVMMAKTICGTPYFFSPELCHGQAYNNKSDVWALGCLLYEVLALDVPFHGKNMTDLMKRIVSSPVPRLPAHVDPKWQALVEAMLSKTPSQRPDINQVLWNPLLIDQFGKIAEEFDKQAAETEVATQSQIPQQTPPTTTPSYQPPRRMSEADIIMADNPTKNVPGFGRRSPRNTPPSYNYNYDDGIRVVPGSSRISPRLSEPRRTSTPPSDAPYRPPPEPAAKREVPEAVNSSLLPEKPQHGGAHIISSGNGGGQLHPDDEDLRRAVDTLDAMISASPTVVPSQADESSALPQQIRTAHGVAEEFRSVANMFRTMGGGAPPDDVAKELAKASYHNTTLSRQFDATNDYDPDDDPLTSCSSAPAGDVEWGDNWCSKLDLTADDVVHEADRVRIGQEVFSLRHSQLSPREDLMQSTPEGQMNDSNRDDWRLAASKAQVEELTKELERERARNQALQSQVETLRARVLSLTEDNLILRREIKGL